jgi:hypothetical protein
MKRTEAVAPFLRASAESVEAGPWTLAGGGELDDRVKHWDPLTDLQLEREIAVDLDQLFASTTVPATTAVTAAGIWRAERTRLRGPGAPVPLGSTSGTVMVTVLLDVPGVEAGGNLSLQTVLMLADDASSNSPIGATRAGSVLWSDQVGVDLEGVAARFPTQVVDFSALTGVADDAPWSLEWHPHDLEQPVLGAVRLLINSTNEVAVEAVREGAIAPEAPAIASVIEFDVTRSLVFGALQNTDFLETPDDYEPETVGRMLAELFDTFWPGSEPKALAARLQSSPHGLEAELQAKSGLLA